MVWDVYKLLMAVYKECALQIYNTHTHAYTHTRLHAHICSSYNCIITYASNIKVVHWRPLVVIYYSKSHSRQSTSKSYKTIRISGNDYRSCKNKDNYVKYKFMFLRSSYSRGGAGQLYKKICFLNSKLWAQINSRMNTRWSQTSNMPEIVTNILHWEPLL